MRLVVRARYQATPQGSVLLNARRRLSLLQTHFAGSVKANRRCCAAGTIPR